MTPLLQSFNERALELTAYFKFIELIERESASLSLPGKRTRKLRRVDERILKILKANFFLLLYNLVESSIQAAFEALYKAIEAEGCSVKELSPALRACWIDAAFSGIKPSSANPDSYREVGRRLVQDIADNARAELNVKSLHFSGNLDAARIRNVCKAHGISHRTPAKTKGGEKLLIVKSNRNALAHGSLSFVECGRDYTVAQLSEIRREASLYLRAILRNIDRFTSKKIYRA